MIMIKELIKKAVTVSMYLIYTSLYFYTSTSHLKLHDQPSRCFVCFRITTAHAARGRSRSRCQGAHVPHGEHKEVRALGLWHLVVEAQEDQAEARGGHQDTSLLLESETRLDFCRPWGSTGG